MYKSQIGPEMTMVSQCYIFKIKIVCEIVNLLLKFETQKTNKHSLKFVFPKKCCPLGMCYLNTLVICF